MAVLDDAVTGSNGFGGSTVTMSHTVSGSNTAMLCGQGNGNGGGASDPVTGIDWGGAALTQLTNDLFVTALRLYTYGLIAPGTGTKTLTVSYSANADVQTAIVTSFTGADQTAPFGTPQTLVTGNGTTATDNIATAAGDMAWLCNYSGWGSQTASAGTLQLSQPDTFGATSLGIATRAASGASTTVTLDRASSSFSDDFGARGIWIKAVSGGGGGNTVAVPLATISLDAKTPTITATANNFIAVPLATITLAAQAPSVAVGGNQSVSVPLATISLNAQAPTVVATDAKSIAVPLATISLDAKTPTITATANQFVSVPTASVTLDGFAPTVTATANNLIQVPAASITLTAIAPAVQAGGPQSIDIPLAAISITVYAPTVTVSQDNQNAGGWWPDYEHISRQRAKRRRELEEAEERTASEFQDEIDRNVLRALIEQERKDADRADLDRLQKLADTYVGKVADDVPKPIAVAIWNAQDARTRNALEQLRRMVDQQLEDELMAVQQIVLLMLTD